MGLHAAFSVLLSRYSNETDIVVGSPIANREQAEVAGLIGFFVNTLVLRSDLSESPSFITLLTQSKNRLLDAYAHQQVPFEQIVERLQPERSLSHSALFQIMLVLQNNEQGDLTLPGLTLSAIEPSGVGIAK
jgi:non-ribosomal peptide synthetase component F